LAELKSGGAQSAELEFKKAELEREQRVFELIAARKLAVQTEMSAPARVSLMGNVTVPALPLDPIPFKLLGLACTLALLAPLGIAVAREVVVRRISSAEQLTQESMLPLLGEVAKFPFRPVAVPAGPLPAQQRRERYVFAESIDSLRTNLMLTEGVGQSGHRKVIAICSAASGEGKSSVASALAISIAEASRQPTLLIDADLRAPDIAGLLGVTNHPGVAEVFSGKAAPLQAIHRVGETHAFVMPAGKQRVNPHHILTGSRIDDLLITLREKFATIVIDTPPLLGASESLVYARTADLVVFCSLADVSRAKQVRVAVEKLQSTGANVAGAVLSGVSVNRYVYNYGAYAVPTS
jgi:capsular exopolysaccharide synthesis family protein